MRTLDIFEHFDPLTKLTSWYIEDVEKDEVVAEVFSSYEDAAAMASALTIRKGHLNHKSICQNCGEPFPCTNEACKVDIDRYIRKG